MSDYAIVHYENSRFEIEHRHNLKTAKALYYRRCGEGKRVALYNESHPGKPKPMLQNSRLCCQWYEREGAGRAFRKYYGWVADAKCADTRLVDSCEDCLRFKEGSCFSAIDFYLREAKGMTASQSAEWMADRCPSALSKEYSRVLSQIGVWLGARAILPQCEWLDKKGKWHTATSPSELKDQLENCSKYEP